MAEIFSQRVLNSLLNAITSDSRDNYNMMITKITQQRISLPQDFTWALRRFLGALLNQASDQYSSRMAYRRINKLSLNGIPS
jgi:hypothetical protein